jgi:hypothetical protein
MLSFVLRLISDYRWRRDARAAMARRAVKNGPWR